MRPAAETAGVGTTCALASAECGGSLLRITLDRPKGNVIDGEMIREIRAIVERAQGAAGRTGARTILIEGNGGNFSFGASVEEHRADKVAEMLGAFHEMLRELAGSGKVVLAAIRGQCLGGGLELAAMAHRIFAAPDARLGCPEIKLGVFAPAASCLLPARIGQRHADDLLLTGRTVDAEEALRIGLVDDVVPDPAAAAIAWHTKHLAPLSSAALAHAVRAARHAFHQGLGVALRAVERQYLDELVRTADATEGIMAFLEKRKPVWRNA
jgi:cyclohexa-1,5-dienecarbonyl-CoA hydratase